MDTKRVIAVAAITTLMIPATITGIAQAGANPSTHGWGGQGIQRGMGAGDQGSGMEANNPLGSEPAGTLTASQEAELIRLAEEEQVAHDLYVLAYDLWGVRQFDNISRSETQHFIILNQALELYGLPSASEMGTPGEYNDPELQAIYDQLAAQVRSSSAEAVQVGVTVEETDIADLKAALSMDFPSDVSAVLNNLVTASERHLAAFVRAGGKASATESSVKVRATADSSRLRINVNPNNAEANYRVKIQKKVDGKWKTMKVVRTTGTKDTRTVNLRAGTYRVKVPAQLGLDKSVSSAVTLQR